MKLYRTCKTTFRLNTLLKSFLLTFLIFSTTNSAFAQAKQTDKKITITFTADKLDGALKKLEKASGTVMAFDPQDAATISVKPQSFTNQSLENILDKLLNGSGFSYKNCGQSITIFKTPAPQSPNVQAGGGPGTLIGRIVEFETSQPLPGASVYIVELQKGMQSNNDGYYSFNNIPAGKYTLQISYVSFSTEKISVEVKAGKEESYDVKMRGSNNLTEVMVSGTRKTRAPVSHTTERQLVGELKAAQSVVSGISSEQISKSADRNAAEVVKRIAGVTVRDDKFIVIRGMNERYNLTYLNGNIAPSTELYSRAFSLDLIPTRTIDRILVYKSPAPDLLGDMTGGAVKIFTKDAKTVKHFDIELQAGIRPGTTFSPAFLTYQGSSTDFLGFDGGTRKLPSTVPGLGNFTKANISQVTYAKSFSNILNYSKGIALPTVQLTANYYDVFKLHDRNLTSLTSFSYKNEPLHLDINREQGGLTGENNGTVNVNGGPAVVNKLGNENQSTETAQLSLLQNLTYHLRDSSTLYFKNFLLQQGQSSTIVRNTATDQSHIDGSWRDVLPLTDRVLRDILLTYQQRFLYSGNLGGDHYFGKGGKQELNWNGGYTFSRLDIPDQRIIHMQNNVTNQAGINNAGSYEQNWVPVFRSQDLFNYSANNLNQGMISRTWTQNTESTYNAAIDYTYKMKSWVTLKAGTYQLWKEREVFRRIYTLNEGDLPASGEPNTTNLQIGSNGQPIDLSKVFFHQQDLNQVWSNDYLRDDGTALKVFDRTSGADAYTATEQNNSVYIAASLLPFNGKLDIYGGLRVEYNRQKVAGSIATDVNNPILTDLKATSYLPSLNIGYRPDDDLVFRAAYGKTVNRPEFVELSPYTDLDYANNQTITGNPGLVSATVNNYDFRVEFYPKNNAKGETISLGAFYKQIDHPIERTIYNNLDVNLATQPANISFLNADHGTVKGIELDIRKNMDFLSGNFFRNLFLIANGSLINSHVLSKNTSPFENQSNAISRQLQGQAPYSFNAGFYYDNAGTGTKIALIGNQVGPNIYAAAMSPSKEAASQGSLIQLKRRQLDFSVTQRLVKSLQAKLSVQNLLNDPVQIAEDDNFSYKYEKAVFIPQPKHTGIGQGPNFDVVHGDLLSTNYKPGRFFLLTLTYGF